MRKIGNLEIYGAVYKITNKINNKVYIGQTTRSFNERYGNNLENNTHNKLLKSDIDQYGIDSFEITEKLDIAFSQDELDIKEIIWIGLYNSTNKDLGYNLSHGAIKKGTDNTKRLSLYFDLNDPDENLMFEYLDQRKKSHYIKNLIINDIHRRKVNRRL